MTVRRSLCKLKFPSSSCSSFEADVTLPSAQLIEEAAKPKPIVLVVKMGVSSPFSGDRANILTKIVRDVALHGGVQLVFLVDRSEWTKDGAFADASDAFPPAFRPLVQGYSIGDIQRLFPTKALKPRAESPTNARARAIGD